MTPLPTRHPLGRTAVSALLGTVLLFGSAGCKVELTDPSTTSASPAGSGPSGTGAGGTGTGASSAAPAASGADSAPCPIGNYAITEITGTRTGQLAGQEIKADGPASGLTLDLAAGGDFLLTGRNGRATLDLAGAAKAQATVNGTVTGQYTGSGSQYRFSIAASTGNASIDVAGLGGQEVGMDEFATALAPNGVTTITCSDAGAVIDSETVTLQLTRTGDHASAASSTNGTATAGAVGKSSGSAADGGAVVSIHGPTAIDVSDLRRTYDCGSGGGPIAINGDRDHLTFTGRCGVLNVNGDQNTVSIETAGILTIDGNGNIVTYRSSVAVNDNGSGNAVDQR